MGARDAEPLLLSKLCDRGAQIQPKSSIVTRTSNGYHVTTYGEHLRRSKRLASALSKCGVKLEDRVATLMWNTGWHFECYHAISCLGAVLHTVNLRLGTADLNYIISHAQDRMMFVDAHLIPLLEQVDASILASLELFICVGENAEANNWSSSVLDPKRTVDYEAFLMSGNEEANSMQRSIADLTSGQDRVTSSIAALQMQVDRLVTTVEEISVAQEQMKKDLSGIMSSSKSPCPEAQSRPEDDLVAQVKQELQDSLKAAEATLQAEAKRSINDAIAQQLVKEHMHQLDVQVRELSESFKPMIARIALLTAGSASASTAEAELSEKGPSNCEEPQPGQSSAQTTSEGPATQATSPTNGTRSVQEGQEGSAEECPLESRNPPAATGPSDPSGCPSVNVIPIQRRSSAPSFYPVAMMPAGTRSPSSRRGTPRSMVVRPVQPAGAPRHGRSTSMCPSAMMWGGSARVPPRNYTPESGFLLSVRGLAVPATSAAAPAAGATVQEASQMNARDQEATRLEAMRLAVASARLQPSTSAREGPRMLI